MSELRAVCSAVCSACALLSSESFVGVQSLHLAPFSICVSMVFLQTSSTYLKGNTRDSRRHMIMSEKHTDQEKGGNQTSKVAQSIYGMKHSTGSSCFNASKRKSLSAPRELANWDSLFDGKGTLKVRVWRFLHVAQRDTCIPIDEGLRPIHNTTFDAIGACHSLQSKAAQTSSSAEVIAAQLETGAAGDSWSYGETVFRSSSLSDSSTTEAQGESAVLVAFATAHLSAFNPWKGGF